MFCTASDNSDIELRITDKIGFIPVGISVGMKQKDKSDSSSEGMKNP